MPRDRFLSALAADLEALDGRGNPKRHERVIVEVLPATDGLGPRYRLAGRGERGYLKMNSNNYLGMNLHPEVVEAEEVASRRFGAGPGAVRFISGTYSTHIELEARLADFHGREAAMVFSAAYAAMVGVFTPLVTPETAIVSDELNHNCIINAIRLARPQEKRVYRHNDVADLDAKLGEVAAAGCRRALVVTDGIFSMRGDHAPLAEIDAVVRRHDAAFPENVVVMVDDSHGVGAYGPTGRGTEEQLGAASSDVLIGTLGKAFGVNGGYVVGSRILVDFLRETAPTYIYSNPITPAEAAAARAAVDLLDSPVGRERIVHLRAVTRRFRDGLVRLGCETLPGEHPVVPLFVRDTPRTIALVRHLEEHGVLATGLNFPVVPKGDETIRFQISADHTERDIDLVLDVLGRFEG